MKKQGCEIKRNEVNLLKIYSPMQLLGGGILAILYLVFMFALTFGVLCAVFFTATILPQIVLDWIN